MFMEHRPLAVTFDCFGTLIDWLHGQRRVLAAFPTLRQHEDALDRILKRREQLEMEIQAQPWQSYAQVLSQSIAQAVTEETGLNLSDRECQAFASGQLGWPPHADVSPALRRLAAVVPIGLLSNCDEALLRLCARRHLTAPVKWLVSAEAVQAYKPAHAHWLHFLAISELPPARVLHVSFTPAYDLEPAAELGFAIGFLRRYGMTVPQHPAPDLVANSLDELVDRVLRMPTP